MKKELLSTRDYLKLKALRQVLIDVAQALHQELEIASVVGDKAPPFRFGFELFLYTATRISFYRTKGMTGKAICAGEVMSYLLWFIKPSLEEAKKYSHSMTMWEEPKAGFDKNESNVMLGQCLLGFTEDLIEKIESRIFIVEFE